MSRDILSGLILLFMSPLVGCGTSEFFTVTVYDSPQRVVRLQVLADVNDEKGYSHPASISEQQMARVLRGLYLEVDSSTLSIPFLSDLGSNTRRRAFSDSEIDFFAPLLVQGLQQATPEEVVTFFETAEVSALYEATTSGGVYVKDRALHVVLSNHSVKTRIWQDVDAYEAPYRLSPLEPINPQPGRLVFQPTHHMVLLEEKGWFESLKGEPWHVAVSYRELSDQ